MFIRETDLFSELPSHIIDEIASLAVEEMFPAGQVLFRRGDLAESLYILEEGAVDITISEGGLVSFPLTSSGDVFGWSALVEPNRYTASAECMKESKVIRIDGARLMRVFEKHPAEGLHVMRRLCGVIASRLSESYKALMSAREESRIASYG